VPLDQAARRSGDRLIRLLNTAMIATAIELSTGSRSANVWRNENFLWSGRGFFFFGYFVGRAAGHWRRQFIDSGGYWMRSLLAAPLYLTYRTYKGLPGDGADSRCKCSRCPTLHLGD